MGTYPCITDVQVSIIDLPTIRPHKLSMTTMRDQSMVIIKIQSDDDIIGLGESTTIGGLAYGQESPEGIKLTIDKYITPIIKGKDATNINVLMFELEAKVKGNMFAKAGVETALLDAHGKRLGLSVSQLLGGSIREDLETLWTLASGDTNKDIGEAQQLIAQNKHRAFKLKIGRKSPKEDVNHVIQIKQALGADVRITVDINQAWDEQTAKKWIKTLQENNIDLVEQPIIKSNHDGLARLTKHFEVPIMADEACATIDDAFKLAKIRGGSVFAVKIMKCGGLQNAAKIAAIAEASDVALYGGTMLEGTIGTAAASHLFSTVSKLEMGTELFGPLLLKDDIVTNPIIYKDFKLEVPLGPGLGIELDEDKFNYYKRK